VPSPIEATVALDAIGGDGGLGVTIAAALASLQSHPDLSLVLVGPEDMIRRHLGNQANQPRLQIQNATQYVEMGESAASALRSKKDSSMRVAIDLVREGRAAACVSAGNTGALMATARFVLKTLPGIDRPAICGVFPRATGQVHMMDLGANVRCSAALLFQFGVMATIMVRYLDGIERPSVGLLNIGIEDIKGDEIIKSASELFRNSRLNYHGFVEGDAIFTGDVDIIVCDGFSGNVALKTSEGLAQMLTKITKEAFEHKWYSRLSGGLALPTLNSIFRRIDHRRYNGAAFLGLRGTVIKSHGGADKIAFAHAIEVARRAINTDLVQHIGEELKQLSDPVSEKNRTSSEG
jgi:glycerol-3-phosphate acyltransferase PlsX